MNASIKELIMEIKTCKLNLKLADQLYDLLVNRISRLTELEYELDKLDVSIKKMTQISFISIYQQLLNERESRLEIEKRYFLKLSIEYNQLEEDISALQFEIDKLRSSASKLNELKKLLEDKLTITKSPLKKKQLTLYKRIFSKIDKKIEIVNEISEAIKQGSKLNRKLNYAIKYLAKIARNEHHLLNKSINSNFIVNLNKYQKRISNLVVDAIILEKEVNDIFQVVMGSDESILYDINSFEKELKASLIADLTKPNSFQSSLHALQNYKFNLMTMIKLLRSDIKKIKKEIAVLEIEEEKIFGHIDAD